MFIYQVGLITKRMTDIEKDLNYLLGRLSLVTQEFNLIKDKLGHALDGIKKSFSEVQSKIKGCFFIMFTEYKEKLLFIHVILFSDVGPGPHKIEDDS